MSIAGINNMRTKKGQRYPRWKAKAINEDLFNAAVISGMWIGEVDHGSSEEATNVIEKILREVADVAMPRVRKRTNTRKNVYWWNLEIE